MIVDRNIFKVEEVPSPKRPFRGYVRPDGTLSESPNGRLCLITKLEYFNYNIILPTSIHKHYECAFLN